MLEARAARADDTYYNLLARALRAGQFNLPLDVPPGFARLADPYDPAANERYRLLEDHPLHDLSYYKGKLFLYFGITPALVLFGPYAALTGHYLLHKDAVVIFCSVGFLASAGLLWAMWRRYFAEVGLAVIAAGTLALGLAAFIPMILPRCDVYEVAISCGYALTMLALAAIWCALHQPRRRGWWLAAASLAWGLAVGARPSLLFGAVILLVPVTQAWRERQPIWLPLLAATGPIVLIGLGLMLYNALRFGNPFEFGMHYALASCRMDTAHDFSWRFLGFNAWVYLLAPARWSARFPFFHDITLPHLPASHFGTEHTFGVLTNLPLVWLALASPLAWRGRSTDERSLLRGFLAALAWVFGSCALTLCFFFAACDRYQMEFVPSLVLLAVVGILSLERALANRRGWRLAACAGWGFLVACSVAFNLLACANRRASSDADLGNILLGRGQVNQAIAHFRRALVIQPDAANVLANLGGALLESGRAAEAVAPLQKALRIQPSSTQAHNTLGAALLQQGLVDEAIAHFQSALKIQPGSAQARNNLGNALLQQGRVNEAIADFQQAVELQPSLGSARQNLGGALLQAGRVDEAVAQLRRALELEPNLAGAHESLGNALLRKGQVNEAIAHLQEAVQLQPGLASAHHNLANAFFQAGQVEEAIAQFQAALTLQPDFAGAHNGLGNALLRKGQVAESLAHFRTAATLQPSFVEAQLNLANTLLQTGQVDEAIAHFQKVLELQPDQAGAHNNLANALLSKGQVDSAIAHFQRALSLQPNLAEAHNGLANALLQKGRAEEAVKHYQAALAVLPTHPRLLNNLAWVLATSPQAAVRDGPRAVELAEQAGRLSGGNDPSMLTTLAAAYAEAGRFPEAIATAQKACDGASAAGDRALLEKGQQHLELYRRNQPFHEPAPATQPALPPKAP
jgi:tetratricopeptide (TPR) repeat protein